MTVLIDTNVIIGILRDAQGYKQQYDEIRDRNQAGITTYIVAELHEGLQVITNPQRRMMQEKVIEMMVEDFVRAGAMYSLSVPGARLFARFKAALQDCGKTIPIIDLLIGTIAIEHSFTLVTSDRGHFEALEQVATPELAVVYFE